ncbi:MAG: helix-hairpin-helix domain-containing protein [Sediminibacterium sp.]|nr:helix-hairpin-helix domain-containing protein [Sediminibacterium sp.]
MMNNYAIADNFSLLSKLMDIHGDNSFKAKSYAAAAFTIEKLPSQLATLPADQIFKIRGIGDSIGKNIVEQLETGRLSALDDYLKKTPEGILEMLSIKGLGPKKIATIWKELEIETLGELLYACNENRLMLYKGFGEKTQQNIRESIEFYMGAQGSYLYQQVESVVEVINQKLKSSFKTSFLLTGEFRRQLEVINQVEWVTNESAAALKDFFTSHDFQVKEETSEFISFTGKEQLLLCFYLVSAQQLQSKLFTTSCSEAFLKEWDEITQWDATATYASEDEIFNHANICPIPAYQRETAGIIHAARNNELHSVIEPDQITGIIHSHSNWSDGSNTIEEMARAAIKKGFQFLVISDHSKSAFYANGLQEDRIKAQHQQIDELNKQLAPFKIYKSIESDILTDGSLDYSNTILNSFDLVIASVHSNLKMSQEKAMSRLINAIENPFTSILGHMTGRLLLSRNGYPVDHEKIIDACVANDVVIELNAHPRRLDIDWRWIHRAMEKNVLISINPDAHAVEGFDDCRYGVLVAQKAGLTRAANLSSFSLSAFEQFVQKQQSKRPR